MSNYEAYLRTSLSKYSYPDLAKSDILNAFRNYTDLRPKLDTFVFNDGSRKELLCLDGTIPVNYKGNTYNIPVIMWLLDTHPYNPPMAYVKPTATMQIKPGQHVDSNGKVYLPYLHDWRHPQSDLFGLIQIMVIIFGENPPVFSRSAAPPRPQYPPGQGQPSTPYPSAGAGMPMPSYPGQQSSGYPTATTGGYPPAYPAQQQGGYPAQQSSYNTQYPSSQPSYANTDLYYYKPGRQRTTVANVQRQGTTISEEHLKNSLVSAVEDKMKRRIRDIFAQHQAEMDTLKRTQDDLQKGKDTLEGMLQKISNEQREVETNITILREKGDELKETVSQMENREELSIDDAVVPTTPLYKQLLNTYAEEQATEDVLYYLGESLRKGVIELDVFLKQIRELSRKQFMLRALIHKCREKAGLPEL